MNAQNPFTWLGLAGLVGCGDPKSPFAGLPHAAEDSAAAAADLEDSDGDGWPATDDCNDNDNTIHPNADEQCNGIDDNCDGVIDDDLTQDWFTDADGDSYGGTLAAHACAGPDGTVAVDGDCDDTDPLVHPWSAHRMDGQDSDCDGRKDWNLSVFVAVDDAGELCINNEVLGDTGGWRDGVTYEIWLRSGWHTVGIHGWDTGLTITAAIAHLELSNGQMWTTDATWRYDPDPDQSGTGKVGWCTTGFNDTEWGTALDIGPIGDPSNPWGSAPSVFPDASPARWIWDHFPVNLNTQYLRYEFELP